MGARRWLLAATQIAVIGALWLVSTLALAQSGGGFGDASGALPQTGGGPAPSGKAPATHAAPGGDNPSLLPTQAARLPPDPNAIPEELQDVLGSDNDPEYEAGKGEEVERKWYGPYYSEESGSYRFQTVFPFWLERQQGEDRSSLYGLTYYQRRSPKVDADVVFPFFWHFRHDKTYTTVVGPVVHSESPTGHTNWLPPLYFEGSDSEDGTEYLHIPALLTFHHRTNDYGFSMVGPVFCKWEGGNACDARSAKEITYGVAPFYFYGRDEDSEWEVIPPLLHYYHYDERNDESVNVWGPIWSEKSRDGGVFNIMPLYWRSWGPDRESTTLFPFFHYSRDGNATTLATPLFVHHVDDENAETFASLLYARHRGRTELDMITPFYWQYRDPDADIERTLLFPFYYRNVSPRDDDIAVFPFYARFKREGISTTHWVTPLVRHETNLTGWQLNIFPLFSMGRSNQSTHTVAAPFFFDFASPQSRETVVFPFFWRFADQDSLTQVVANTLYHEEEVEGGSEWEFHFFPFFSYGETPIGHWWNVLYGLAGYTREGTMAKMRLVYIPIKLSN